MSKYQIVMGRNCFDSIKFIASLNLAVMVLISYEVYVNATIRASCACGPVAILAEAAKEI